MSDAAIKTETKLVKNIVKDLKKGKARDTETWNNEMIIDGGDEMVRSMELIADMVKEGLGIPKTWKQILSH